MNQTSIEKPTLEKIAETQDNFFGAYQQLMRLQAERKNSLSAYNDEIKDQKKYLAELEKWLEEAKS